jgi:hypothetical protein
MKDALIHQQELMTRQLEEDTDAALMHGHKTLTLK